MGWWERGAWGGGRGVHGGWEHWVEIYTTCLDVIHASAFDRWWQSVLYAMSALYSTVMNSSALYCIVLSSAALFCIVLHCTQ
jgi:hypothetical protein